MNEIRNKGKDEGYEGISYRRSWIYWTHSCFSFRRSRTYASYLDSLVTGRKEFTEGKIFYQGDIADRTVLEQIFTDHPEIKHCIHFAALIVVPDSVENPYGYYTEKRG